MSAAFRSFLRKLVRKGRLEVVTADGIAETFGDGAGPPLGVKLLDGAAERRLMVNPALTLGELYMDGRLVLTKGGLYDLLELGARNLAELEGQAWAKALKVAGETPSTSVSRRVAMASFCTGVLWPWAW